MTQDISVNIWTPIGNDRKYDKLAYVYLNDRLSIFFLLTVKTEASSKAFLLGILRSKTKALLRHCVVWSSNNLWKLELKIRSENEPKSNTNNQRFNHSNNYNCFLPVGSVLSWSCSTYKPLLGETALTGTNGSLLLLLMCSVIFVWSFHYYISHCFVTPITRIRL